jgi:hypothetical protein
MSPETLTVIEEAAKMREDLTWAMEKRKTVTGERAPYNRPHKAPRGGQQHTAAHGRGQGRGHRKQRLRKRQGRSPEGHVGQGQVGRRRCSVRIRRATARARASGTHSMQRWVTLGRAPLIPHLCDEAHARRHGYGPRSVRTR